MTKKHVILFDGDCNFCNKAVNFILTKDSKNQFLFANLHSKYASDFLACNYSLKNIDSIFLISENNYYYYSEATLKIGTMLSFPINILSYFGFIVPKFIRDVIYRKVASFRKNIIKKDYCIIPTVEQKTKFLS